MNNKIKHELEKIEIPDELHNRVILGTEQAHAEKEAAKQKHRGRASSHKKRGIHFKKLSLVAALMLVIASTLTFTPAFAAIQELYDKVFSSEHIDDTGVRTALKSGEGQVLDQTFYDSAHDISVHFDRILTDDKETKLLLTYQSDKTNLENYHIDLFEGVSSINLISGNEKKKLSHVGWGSRYYDSKENKVAIALSFESMTAYEGKDVRLEIEDLTVWKESGMGSVETTWPLELKLDSSAVSERETVELNKEFTFKGESYTIKQVEFSSLETRVVVTGTDTKVLTDESGMEYEVMSQLEGQYLNARKVSEAYGYSVDDEKSGVFVKSAGEKVDPIFSKGEVEGAKDEYIMTFAPVKDRHDSVLEVGDDIKIPLSK